MKKIFWNNILRHLKQGNSLNSNLNDVMEGKDIQSENLLNDIEKVWNTVQYQASQFNPDKEKAWTSINKQIYNNVKSISIPLNRVYQFAVVILILIVGAFSVYIMTTKAEKPVVFQYAALNGKSKVMLPDGSYVWLAPHSEIAYTNVFNPTNREIVVKGKAYLEVQKDSIHPFIVKVDQSVIKVYGTSFNINDMSQSLSVSLLSGKISFQSDEDATPVYVKPGQSLTLDKFTRDVIVEDADVNFEALWAQDKLKVEEMSLGDVVKYLNQWYDAEITLSPELQGQYKYTFTITTEQLDEILRMMARINPMEITYDKKKVTIK